MSEYQSDTTLDPQVDTGTMTGSLLVNIKTSMVTALEETLADPDYPDKKIQGINVSMDYPTRQVEFPSLWVQFSLRDLQAASVGGQYVLEDGYLVNTWMYNGTFTLSVYAMTSFERDVYASQLVEFFAFGDLNPVTSRFYEIADTFDNLSQTINRDKLVPQGQNATVGTPWAPDDVQYSDTYSFDVTGQFHSRWKVTPAILRRIDVFGDMGSFAPGEGQFEHHIGLQ